MGEYIAIAIIDLSTGTLHIYDVPESFNSEQTEAYIEKKLDHRIKNISWGQFDGEINDHRND